MRFIQIGVAVIAVLSATSEAAQLTVVQDKGGDSALPYYRSLNPQADAPATNFHAVLPSVATTQGMPIKSVRLSPGYVEGRVINAPGLQPVFLIGDDDISKAWLSQRGDTLRQMQALGLVVNVVSAQRLAVVKSWAPGLTLAPTSGDDLAQRLGVSHYPILITATAVEQ